MLLPVDSQSTTPSVNNPALSWHIIETLIADGRIHPARIEEVVAKIESNMEQLLFEAGEEAAYKASIQGLDPELLKKLGFRPL